MRPVRKHFSQLIVRSAQSNLSNLVKIGPAACYLQVSRGCWETNGLSSCGLHCKNLDDLSTTFPLRFSSRLYFQLGVHRILQKDLGLMALWLESQCWHALINEQSALWYWDHSLARYFGSRCLQSFIMQWLWLSPFSACLLMLLARKDPLFCFILPFKV